MAVYRKRSASALRKSKNGANESGNEIANVVATKAAPVTNHLSWSRSSPTDRRNRTTTATNAAMSPIGTPKKATVSTTPAAPPTVPPDVVSWEMGSDQFSVATIIAPNVRRIVTMPMNQPTGRHRREGK